jgi:hypothetical protein
MSERRGPKVQKDHMDSYCLQQPAYYCQAYGTAQMGGSTGEAEIAKTLTGKAPGALEALDRDGKLTPS